jgi:hypothetical protein
MCRAPGFMNFSDDTDYWAQQPSSPNPKPTTLTRTQCSSGPVSWRAKLAPPGQSPSGTQDEDVTSGFGRAHRGKPVSIIISSKPVIVTDKRTGEILSENKVEPGRSYWKKLPKEDHTLDL